MTRIPAYLLLLFSFVLVSCISSNHYDDYQTFDHSGWHKDSIAQFEFEINDTHASFNLFINVRNLGDYPYSNLWLFVDIEAPDSTSIRDTVEYQLALPDGKWTGKGNTVYSNSFPFREDVYFPVKGPYRFKLQQAMRIDELKGISNIGLRVEKR
ncbi:MAG: gliding motility lipoprotein GldH [Prolixibacteraceae bacterium]|nr:gliding motility lipoprotein GldH [Prolixibacteraceae bacterium]